MLQCALVDPQAKKLTYLVNSVNGRRLGVARFRVSGVAKVSIASWSLGPQSTTV